MSITKYLKSFKYYPNFTLSDPVSHLACCYSVGSHRRREKIITPHCTVKANMYPSEGLVVLDI